jgi:hypothetical protein
METIQREMKGTKSMYGIIGINIWLIESAVAYHFLTYLVVLKDQGVPKCSPSSRPSHTYQRNAYCLVYLGIIMIE